MLYLLLCILSTSVLLIVFKLFHRFEVQTLYAIVVNYLTCTVLGLLLLPDGLQTLKSFRPDVPWLWIALVLGAAFMGNFYLLSRSTEMVGVTVTAVANKISLIIPVAVSLFIWKTAGNPSATVLAGIAVALAAITLSSWQPARDEPHPHGYLAWLLPLVVFGVSGLSDTLLNLANYKYLKAEEGSLFTFALFATAAALGVLAAGFHLLRNREPVKGRSILGGLALGIPNFLTVLFLLKALTAFHNNGAFLYPVNNIGVILLTALAGRIFFKEHLSRLNLIGIALAVLALGLLSWGFAGG